MKNNDSFSFETSKISKPNKTTFFRAVDSELSTVQKKLCTARRIFFDVSIRWTGCSPILSHVNATLQGLASVHTSNAQQFLEEEFHEFQDHNVSSWYLSMCAQRWFGFWLDFVSLMFVASVVYSFLLLENGKWLLVWIFNSFTRKVLRYNQYIQFIL